MVFVGLHLYFPESPRSPRQRATRCLTVTALGGRNVPSDCWLMASRGLRQIEMRARGREENNANCESLIDQFDWELCRQGPSYLRPSSTSGSSAAAPNNERSMMKLVGYPFYFGLLHFILRNFLHKLFNY